MKYWYKAVDTIASNWVFLACVWVVVAAGIYGFFIVPKGGYTSFSFGELDSGFAALLGALIGSGTTITFGLWQAKVQARQTRNEKLFDAKRLCYSEAIAHFSVAILHFSKKEPYPVKDDDKAKHHRIMSELVLLFLSGKDVTALRNIFINKISEIVTEFKEGKDAKKQVEELKIIDSAIRSAMRSELGLQK